MRESHEEAGEEPAKVGWTCGKNESGTIDEESGFASRVEGEEEDRDGRTA